MNCPNPHCGRELYRLGKGQDGQWTPTNKYRCNDCPTGSNRFVLDRDGKPVKEKT